MQSIDFRQWFEQHIPNITWRGDEGQSSCPLSTHGSPDKKPSFSVNSEKGSWYCHTEGIGGGIKDLAARLGIDSPFQSKESVSFATSPQLTVKALAADKGFTPEFLNSLGVTQGKNHVKISYLLEDGSPAHRQRIRRALRAKDGSIWAKGDGSPTLYGLWRLNDARDKGLCVFVEGESDCWTLWHHGFPALGFPGADMTGKLKIKHIEGILKIYIVREPDKGGDTFIAGFTRQFGSWKTWKGELFEVCLSELTGSKDPNDLHKKSPDQFKSLFTDALEKAKHLELKPEPPQKNETHTKMALLFPFTDLGNAERLIHRHGKDIRYCHPWGKWLVWNGRRWQMDETAAVERMAVDTVRHIYEEASGSDDKDFRRQVAEWALTSESNARIKAMLERVKSLLGIPVLPIEFDRDVWLLNCLNGTINLKTGELQPHRREDLITKLAPVEYDPAAKCPLWKKFLNEIMGGNQNLVGFLHRGAGAGLTGDISEHMLFVPHGAGRNGKSTFLNTVMLTMGDYAISAPPDLLMATKNDRHPTELADLFGKRFVAAIESDQGRRLAEGLVKHLTGGDTIKARRMREDFWEFKPTHKLWFATNHKPRVRGTDIAIWSRIKLIPFEVQFLDGDPRQDKKLPEKLKGELPGILRWCVEGCLAWQREGMGVPKEVKTATDSYRQEQDVLAGFITDCCIVNPLAKVPAGNLYKEYVAWCNSNGEHPLAQRTLGTQLIERGFTSQRGTAGRHFWQGMGLRSDVSDPSDRNSRINGSSLTRGNVIRETGSLTSLGSLKQEHPDSLNGNPGDSTAPAFAALPDETELEDWKKDKRW